MRRTGFKTFKEIRHRQKLQEALEKGWVYRRNYPKTWAEKWDVLKEAWHNKKMRRMIFFGWLGASIFCTCITVGVIKLNEFFSPDGGYKTWAAYQQGMTDYRKPTDKEQKMMDEEKLQYMSAMKGKTQLLKNSDDLVDMTDYSYEPTDILQESNLSTKNVSFQDLRNTGEVFNDPKIMQMLKSFDPDSNHRINEREFYRFRNVP